MLVFFRYISCKSHVLINTLVISWRGDCQGREASRMLLKCSRWAEVAADLGLTWVWYEMGRCHRLRGCASGLGVRLEERSQRRFPDMCPEELKERGCPLPLSREPGESEDGLWG